MKRQLSEPMKLRIECDGQPYVDEPILKERTTMLRPRDIAAAVSAALGSAIPDPIQARLKTVVAFKRRPLIWMTRGPDGRLVKKEVMR